MGLLGHLPVADEGVDRINEGCSGATDTGDGEGKLPVTRVVQGDRDSDDSEENGDIEGGAQVPVGARIVIPVLMIATRIVS